MVWAQGWVAILARVFREGLTETVALEQRLEGGREGATRMSAVRAFQTEGTTSASAWRPASVRNCRGARRSGVKEPGGQ